MGLNVQDIYLRLNSVSDRPRRRAGVAKRGQTRTMGIPRRKMKQPWDIPRIRFDEINWWPDTWFQLPDGRELFSRISLEKR